MCVLSVCHFERARAGRRGGARTAVTLVELLVVLVVLAVLAAILIPTGSRAIEEAHIAQCRANLRNLGHGALLFAKDHDGSLPVSDVLDGPHAALLAALRPYVGDARVYYCPSETAPERVFSGENVEAGRIGYFYYSCERATGNSAVSTFLRWSVQWPRRLQNTMDARTWVASDAWFSGEATAHPFGQKIVNYLTLGGDVQMVEESPRQAFK